MKILVTGAAGFIGSHLTEALCAAGHEGVGLDAFTDYYARPLKESNAAQIRAAGATLLELDLATDDLAAALSDVDAIYHLAAQPGIDAATPFDAYLRNNLVATHRLLDTAQRMSRPPFFINIATSSVYGQRATDPEDAPPQPTSPYGVTKLAAEQLALAYHRESRLSACSLRIFSVIGPRERPEKLFPKLIHAILTGTEFRLYEGSEHHRRSFSYVGDIVSGLVSVLENRTACGGEIINLGSDQEHATGQAIALVEEILQAKAKIVHAPPRPGDQLKTHANIAKARQLLGFDPKTDLKQALQAEVHWYADTGLQRPGAGRERSNAKRR